MAYIGRDVQYGTLEKQDLVGDGSQTVFTLNYGVATAASLMVSVGGVIQEPDTAYTVSGSQLTFTAAPGASDNVYVVFLGKELMDMAKKELSYQTATGDGSNVNPITLSNSAENAHELMVMLNGVTQVPVTDYTVDGTTLTFTTAPANGVNILVYHLGYAVALGGNLGGTMTAHIIPDTHAVYDLGTAEKKIRHLFLSSNSIYMGDDDATIKAEGTAIVVQDLKTGDLHLDNTHRNGNSVDGTKGSWTFEEGADDLFLLNNVTGKKYKFNLTEI